MALDRNQIDLFFSFIARHKRFLKLRETSFNSKQLESGVKLCEKAVKAVQMACKSLSLSPFQCVESPSSKGKAIRALRKKVPRLSPKQAVFILEHFEAFQSAVSLAEQPIGHKPAKQVSEYVDRYYQPVEHNYR